MDAANEVIKHNAARRPKNLWTENGSGQPIAYFQARDDREEAEFVVGQIRSCSGNASDWGIWPFCIGPMPRAGCSKKT